MEYMEKADRLWELLNQENDYHEKIYEHVTFSDFYEIANEEGIKVGKTFVTKMLKLWNHESPEKHRRRKDRRHEYRRCKDMMGELVQIDGSPCDWFCLGEKRCLQMIVDDSTNTILGAYFTRNECLLGYIECLRQMLLSYGIPENLYADRTRLLFRNYTNEEGQKCEDSRTQLGNILGKLGIGVIAAHSPQAKGRVERDWKTLQQRLPVRFRKLNIKDIDEANKYLVEKFIPYFNKRFGRPPRGDAEGNKSVFVEATSEQISSALKAVFEGRTDAGGVFSLFGYRFFVPGVCKANIRACFTEKDGLWVERSDDFLRTRHEVILCETDTTGLMPEVYKDLIEKIFLHKAKPKFREVYYELPTELDDEYKKRHTKQCG